jgi:hypothetical protein
VTETPPQPRKVRGSSHQLEAEVKAQLEFEINQPDTGRRSCLARDVQTAPSCPAVTAFTPVFDGLLPGHDDGQKRETPAAFETTGVSLTYRKSAGPSMNRSSFFEAATPGHSRCCHNLNCAAPPPD